MLDYVRVINCLIIIIILLLLLGLTYRAEVQTYALSLILAL